MSSTILPKMLAGTLLALLASLAVNVLLGRVYLGQRDKTVAAVTGAQNITQQRDGVRAAANACSAGVQQLGTLAAERKAEGVQARAAAVERARPLEQRVDQTLATPAAVPGEACASAQIRVDDWLRARAAP